MSRTVQHTRHISLDFEETCRRIEARGEDLLERATFVASRSVDRSASVLEGFEVDQVVSVAPQEFDRGGDHQASMRIRWNADVPTARLLPQLDAKLVVHGVIPRGPHATTAISILGTHDAPHGIRQRLDDRLFRRRLVDDAAAAFLDAFVVGLVDGPIDLRSTETESSAA